MIFKCRNCGGNVVYSPEKGAMHCPHCDGVDSQQKVEGKLETECANCGAPLHTGKFASASKCEHCGHYIVFDDKVQGAYEPGLILPFKVGKEKVKEILRSEFKKRAFTPASFLSEASLDNMEGTYVPFWLYDYISNCVLDGDGTKIRTWRSGNKEYTETSYYHVEREMDINFSKIPVDASIAMDDGIMDLMEPYNYQALENFQDKYISGFYAEFFNDTAENLESRAKLKAQRDSEALIQESVGGYSSLNIRYKNIRLNRLGYFYALFPVWVYTYSYRDETFSFYVNGQTGKVIGKTPLSVQKLAGYGTTVFLMIFFIFEIICKLF